MLCVKMNKAQRKLKKKNLKYQNQIPALVQQKSQDKSHWYKKKHTDQCNTINKLESDSWKIGIVVGAILNK